MGKGLAFISRELLVARCCCICRGSRKYRSCSMGRLVPVVGAVAEVACRVMTVVGAVVKLVGGVVVVIGSVVVVLERTVVTIGAVVEVVS